MRIYTSRYPCPPLPTTSIFEFLYGEGSRAANADPEQAALIDGMTGEKVTYPALRRSSLLLASGLSSLCASFNTSTVLLLSRASIYFPYIVLAASAARLSVSLADPAAMVYELVLQLKASGAGVVVVEADEELLKKVMEAAKKVGLGGERLVVMPSALSEKGLTTREVAERGLKTTEGLMEGTDEFEPVRLSEDQAKNELAYMPWSAGLGGASKLTHISPYNVTSQVVQIAATPGVFIPGDVKLMALPMAYAIGVFVELYLSIHLGSTLVVYPSFDLPTVLAGIEKYRAQTLIVVGPLVPLFIHDPQVEKYDLSALRWLGTGGSAIPSSAQRALTRRINSLRRSPSGTGAQPFVFFQAGGMTETTCISFIPSFADGLSGRSDGNVGGLVTGFEARVVSVERSGVKEGEDEVRDVEEGELWLRGASVTKGYVHDLAATKATFTTDGWLRTGDLVKVSSDGLFSYTGRLKPMIKNKGLQANPTQLEEVTYLTGFVEDCAILGVWSGNFLTEAPRAFVVAKEAATLSDAELAALVKKTVKKHLSPQKWLAGGVEVVKAIPRRKDGSVDLAALAGAKQKQQQPKEEIRALL